MLPTPARNPWSSRSGFNRPFRARIRLRKTRAVNAGSSGSGPKPLKPLPPPSSPTRSPSMPVLAATPTRPNLRMSRNRSSRLSANSRTSRMYGSSANPARITNSWPVIFRWIVIAVSSSRSRTTSFARLDVPTISRPTTARANASGSCDRSVFSQDTRTPAIRAPTTSPRRSRATVSTSGSSGMAAYQDAAGSATGRHLGGRFVGLGEERIATRDGRHRLPVPAHLHVDGERHVQRQRALHRLAQDRDQPVDLVARHLEQQLVVDLEERARAEAAGPQPLVETDHRDLHDVGCGPLDGHVDGHPLACGAERGIARSQFRDLPLPP